jgi:hypothetical protein
MGILQTGNGLQKERKKTEDNWWSQKLTWALSSDDLRKKILKIYCISKGHHQSPSIRWNDYCINLV